MIFVGVALLFAVGLALVISSDAGQLVGLEQAETAQLVGLMLILVLIAGGSFGRRYPLSQMLANIVIWVGIFGVFAVGYTYRAPIMSIANRVMGELAPGQPVVSSDGSSVSVTRSLSGSFQINVGVNNTQLLMIFDTGASSVVLSFDDAEASGIDVDNLQFTVPVQTANGTGRAAQIRLARIQIGSIVRNNVSAFVAQKDALDTSLLGMSFLETLSSFAVAGDRLELRN